jgi:hypothetical protein
MDSHQATVSEVDDGERARAPLARVTAASSILACFARTFLPSR